MQRYQKHLSESELLRLNTVREYADIHISGLVRRTGETYAEHGWEVAQVLLECTNDVSLLSVAVLHDILLHDDGEALLEKSPLDKDEKRLIRQMHKLRRLNIKDESQDLDTVIDAFMEDEKLLPLRMAHRVSDIRQLHKFSKELQALIAEETLHMYSSIAGRLGMQAWRYEMEDTSFTVTHPDIVADLQQKFDEALPADTACLDHTMEYLSKKLHSRDLPCEFEKRIKGIYSTYRKMIIKNRTFEELTDRLAIRILVDSTDDCYLALGIIHSVMNPMAGKLKDYIGSPKENGYKSIHTVVYPLPGITEQPIEIQLRTRTMHEYCNFGAASHNLYKDNRYALTARAARVNLFRNLGTLRSEASDPNQFAEVLRTYFREDQVAVFDKDNNLYHLPKPASVLDFIYHAFPSRWTKAKGVTVNGRNVQLSTIVRDGDIINIDFCRQNRFEPSWSDACTHKKTKDAIVELTKS